MLLELAIADAYGAGFEYADEMIFANDLSRYVQHPRYRLIPGSYTDDTQMKEKVMLATSINLWSKSGMAPNF